ncbi:glycosyltransferase family 2 protein [Brucella intermedia]|uniref:glycosyltransferase family 2 protein n=1 Tax=Brucella intermedia TaxID=94625 RepID=UPI00124C6B00|nr:glycosyltransferase family A protein [Brucella intermedia]KAB2692449.1 glycosyltransferase family 2 protein [Brucella intermedia]
MKSRSSVSIVIPHFNQGGQLQRCLRLLLPMLLSGDEVVIVDDNSNFFPSIEDIYDPWVRVVYLKLNSGPSNARNIGAGIAKNDFIAFLDADDHPVPTRFDHQVNFLARNPECLGCVGGYLYQRDGRGKSKSVCFESSNIYRDVCGGSIFAAGSTLMFRRESFLALGGYDIKLRVYEDWDLLLRTRPFGSLGHCGCGVAEISPSSRRANTAQRLRALEVVFSRHSKQLSKSELSLFRQAIAYEKASAYFGDGEKIRAIIELFSACSEAPVVVARRLLRRLLFGSPL